MILLTKALTNFSADIALSVKLCYNILRRYRKALCDTARKHIGGNIMIDINVGLDFFGMVLILIPIIYILHRGQLRDDLDRSLLLLSVTDLIMLCADVCGWIMISTATVASRIGLVASSVVCFSCPALLTIFFAQYLNRYLKLTRGQCMVFHKIIAVLSALQMFLTVTSPFTELIFYIDASGYHRGNMFIISQIIPFICYIVFIFYVVIYRKRLAKGDMPIFLCYIIVPMLAEFIQMLNSGLGIIGAALTFAIILLFSTIHNSMDIKRKAKQKRLDDMRTDIMLSQIQPIFLYDTLDAVAELNRQNDKSARRAVREFSQYLKANLDSLKNRETIPFEQEMRHVMSYLYLQQLRYEDKFRVNCELKAEGFSVPALSILPIVDSAVHSAVLNKYRGGLVQISAEEEKDDFVVSITDNGEIPEITVNENGEFSVPEFNMVSRILDELTRGRLRVTHDENYTTVKIIIPKNPDFRG